MDICMLSGKCFHLSERVIPDHFVQSILYRICHLHSYNMLSSLNQLNKSYKVVIFDMLR